MSMEAWINGSMDTGSMDIGDTYIARKVLCHRVAKSAIREALLSQLTFTMNLWGGLRSAPAVFR